VLLMLDETIITEAPPWYCCYGRIGQQVSVPSSGGTCTGRSLRLVSLKRVSCTGWKVF
jgi:hypothetical protein